MHYYVFGKVNCFQLLYKLNESHTGCQANRKICNHEPV